MLYPRLLLGSNASSKAITEFIRQLTALNNSVDLSTLPAPETKAYPGILYLNYYELGISLEFKFNPTGGTGSNSMAINQEDFEHFELESIHIYNSTDISDRPKSRLSAIYKAYPDFPINLQDARNSLQLTCNMTGKEIIKELGEPERKGGGTGNMNIWCEWTKEGVMIEFGGVDSRGPLAWERGKDATWSVVTLFLPKI